MSTSKEELLRQYSSIRSHMCKDHSELNERVRGYHERALELIDKLEKQREDCLRNMEKESRENYRLREEKKVLYSAIRALTK